MFYEGSLQEAIQTALQESKLVVCFVADDSAESIRWEAEFLTDDAIKDKLASQAVSLRLEAGSEEAGYLEALFPVPRKPTMVMIHNGALKEYIAPGLSKEEFIQRTLKALGYASPETPAAVPEPQSTAVASSSATDSSTSAGSSTAQATHDNNNNDDDNVDDHLYGDSSPSSSAAAATPNPQPTPQQRRIFAMLAERAERLEADKKAKEAKEKAEREARAKARKESNATDASGSSGSTNTAAQDNIKPAERKHAQEVRQQKILDKEHRQRILKRIEDDRKERKERDAQEKQARLLQNVAEEADGTVSSSMPIPLTTRLTESSSKAGKDGEGAATLTFCAVQVRLFDGSVIRARFPCDSTLEKDVRSWIDEDRTDEAGRYTFRHVLTPLPNKAISSEEEKEKTLQELGMVPSATLVLVPVSFATAYHENPRGDVLGKALWPIVYLFGSGWRMVTGFLGLLFGGGSGRDDGGARAMGLEPTRGATTSSRVRDGEGIELKERGKKKKEKKTGEGEQNYDNGNSLSFEPRHDSDEDDEE